MAAILRVLNLLIREVIIVLFERYNERIPEINKLIHSYAISNINEAREICLEHNIDCHEVVRSIQAIAFEDACWAYTVGAAIALKQRAKTVNEISNYIGKGLQSFAIKGSVSDLRKVGLGHGNFAAKLLDDSTKNFAFVAGHESFAAAEGALGVIKYANAYRKVPIKVILVGLGKPAAKIISRYKGFTYVDTVYNFNTKKLTVINEIEYGDGMVKCYGAHSVDEGVSILQAAQIDTIITGNSTSHIKFTDPTVATYKKVTAEQGEKVFCVASGGGTGRTMHPDNVGAGGASYGMTDTTGRMHSNLQFAGSSSVPSHVEMVGFIGMGNNPIVGATVSVVCITANVLKIKDEEN